MLHITVSHLNLGKKRINPKQLFWSLWLMKPNTSCMICRYLEKSNQQNVLSAVISNILNVHGVHACLWKPAGTSGWGKKNYPPFYPSPGLLLQLLLAIPSVQHLALFRVSQTEASTFPSLPSSLRHLWQHELQTHFLAFWPYGSQRLWLGSSDKKLKRDTGHWL